MWGELKREGTSGTGGWCEKWKVAVELQEAQGCSQVAPKGFCFIFSLFLSDKDKKRLYEFYENCHSE